MHKVQGRQREGEGLGGGAFAPTFQEIQNEIIAIIANYVIRDLVSDIRGGCFSII